jgi:essential nuclear protein 1
VVIFFFCHTHRVGQLLHSYRAGPLPKPFKIIPSLPAWARILALTAPEQWSPQAAHAATRIFISNMKPPQARVYLEGVILGLVRADLDQPSTRKDTRKLSPHLYEALKRALYKPAAFFKGIVFPLLDVSCLVLFSFCYAWTIWSQPCVALGRVHAQGGRHRRVGACQSQGSTFALLGRAHPARRHGLLWCALSPHFLPLITVIVPTLPCTTGPTSLFIRVLLDKKHALPYKVLDALVFHFIRLANTHAPGTLPILWHQSLLVLCQRYAAHLAPEQKDALRDVVRKHAHAQISPEIRRELAAVPARGEQPAAAATADAMDIS